jgi:hypothetical protein
MFDPATLKHLEFIEAVIARLGGNGFLLKGWALTVAAAFFGFSAKEVSWRIALVSLVPLVAFWALDAYFLHRERLFRNLYDAVRTGDSRVEPFSMNYSAFAASGKYRSALCAAPLKGFYGALCVVGAMLVILTATHLL